MTWNADHTSHEGYIEKINPKPTLKTAVHNKHIIIIVPSFLFLFFPIFSLSNYCPLAYDTDQTLITYWKCSCYDHRFPISREESKKIFVNIFVVVLPVAIILNVAHALFYMAYM